MSASARTTVRDVAAATIGHGMENYAFSVYALMSGVIAEKYFPASNPALSLLASVATFGVSFLIRPFGAIVLGVYADRRGRIPALSLCIKLMFIGTVLMAFMPSYASIGVLAPIGMFLALLIKGFSYGGEFSSAASFLIERNPARRGFFGSWVIASQSIASLLAAVLLTVLTAALPDTVFDAWAWRIPLAFGVLVGPVGYYLRRKLRDSAEYHAARTEVRRHPLREVFSTQKTRMLLVIGLVAFSSSSSYLVTYMPTMSVRELGMPSSATFLAAVVGYTVSVVADPVAGHCSDRFGRVRVMVIGSIGLAVTILPLFLLLTTNPLLPVMITVMALIALIKSCYTAPNTAFKAEIFPTHIRSTGLSIGYNIGLALFGGCTQLISTGLIQLTGTALAPSFWLIATAIISTVSVCCAARLGRSRPREVVRAAVR
ncbi:MFS transporter [Sciscionella marina]|uniref:MFS transporter n=1 Tax=Sciscionella marina TaxID=508770 RepID=UPI00037298D3|nr:MFS transporter [Sciscionella marina]